MVVGGLEEIRRGERGQRSWQIPVALALIGLFTMMHYLTDTHDIAFHNVYRRLYYLPILILSFSHGLRGGLVAAALTSAAYIPHAFFSAHRDPSPDIDKVLEIALYFIIGGLTGWLVGRQKRVQRSLELALEERNLMERQLVRAGRLSALGQLTAGLAHEIRNPLGSILGCAEALAADFGPEHRKHRLGQLLLKEINRLGQVVEDFLRFSRPSPVSDAEVDLREVIDEVCALTANERRRLEIALEVEVEPGRAVVRGDRGQLSQVLLNVTLNAYQALERAGPRPRAMRVIARAKEIGERRFVQVGIVDNGAGIDAALIEEVFNPYFTTRSEGSGLGLSISNRIMEAHGGFMDIDSQPGRMTVWLSFPREVAA